MDADIERFEIQAAQNGSEHAWRQLFERHFEAVYKFCVVLAGGRHDLAEELTQQVFVTAARRIYSFDSGRATFRAWLIGVAKNRYMTIRDSEQRRKLHEENSVKENPEMVTVEDFDLRVHETLARLPFRYRFVLEAKYLKGLTMTEIASKDGASIEAIESLLRRARAGFARVYEQIQKFE